jgi:hypothetical protein
MLIMAEQNSFEWPHLFSRQPPTSIRIAGLPTGVGLMSNLLVAPPPIPFRLGDEVDLSVSPAQIVGRHLRERIPKATYFSVGRVNTNGLSDGVPSTSPGTNSRRRHVVLRDLPWLTKRRAKRGRGSYDLGGNARLRRLDASIAMAGAIDFCAMITSGSGLLPAS